MRDIIASLAAAGGFRFLDQFDNLIDVRQRDGQTFEDVAAIARLAQLEHSAARNDFAAMTQEYFNELFQVQQAWLVIDQRHHVHAE